VPKTMLIQDRVVKFKISSALWEVFRIKHKRKARARLRQLITKDMETGEA